MDLSYAQNLEDYVLWRALGAGEPGAMPGFYIDVGAGHPVADNVSCAFYAAGWRGIVVEPQENLASAYAFVRPRDTLFCGVAGARSGEAEFHVVDRLHGMSSLDAKAAATAAQFGAACSTRRVPMTTLDELIARAAGETALAIDFLKIDVEGAEAQVLAGLDLSRHRPKAMCIEAVAPGDMADNWSEWEPRLLAHGYSFMLFDGLNRYYAARDAGDVLARFPREKPEWGVIPTFGLWERAPTNSEHPDHALARTLVRGLLAALPMLDKTLVVDVLTAGMTREELDGPATPQAREAILSRLLPGGLFMADRARLAATEAASGREFCERIVGSDAFRLALARIAMSYDGGQIVEGQSI